MRAVVVVVVMMLTLSSSSSSASAACARACLSEPCGTADLRYGKYCGVGHTGCPGEAPCDALDACCERHDKCVGDGMGIFDVKCHTELKECIAAIPKDAKPFEGNTCPWPKAKEAITAGMDLGIAFGSLLSGAGAGAGAGAGGKRRKAPRRRRSKPADAGEL